MSTISHKTEHRFGQYNSLPEAIRALADSAATLTAPNIIGVKILETTWGAVSYCEIAAQDDPVWVINVLVNEAVSEDDPVMRIEELGYNPFSEE